MDRTELIEAGVDYDEGVDRFGGRPELYEKYLRKFFSGNMMADIELQLEKKDIPGAFRTTHDLKGASGNLSLNRFYGAICQLTEQLRDGAADGDYSNAFDLAKTWYEKAKRAIKEAQ